MEGAALVVVVVNVHFATKLQLKGGNSIVFYLPWSSRIAESMEISFELQGRDSRTVKNCPWAY